MSTSQDKPFLSLTRAECEVALEAMSGFHYEIAPTVSRRQVVEKLKEALHRDDDRQDKIKVLRQSVPFRDPDCLLGSLNDEGWDLVRICRYIDR